MPDNPSPPINEPGPRFHSARCCSNPNLEARWGPGLQDSAHLTIHCLQCATELLVLDPPGSEYSESAPEVPAPVLPVPVIDLASFQALVRWTDSVDNVADQTAANAARIGDRFTSTHADAIRADARALEELARQLVPYTEAIAGDTGGHTPLDVHSLRRAGIDPTATQPREGSVPCTSCTEPTWNLAAGCDIHYQPPMATICGPALAGVTS